MARAVSGPVRHPLATAVVALIAASATTGCAIGGAPAEPTIDPRVTVLPELAGMIVTPSALTVPRAGNAEVLADLAIGDIVVSAQGEGFLRTVGAIDVGADTIVLATTDAELGDALIDAEIAAALGGAGKADTHQLPALRFSLADQRIVDNSAITARIVEGELGLEPELDLDLAIENRRLANFEMVLRGRMTGSIDVEIDARDVAVGPEITLWQSPPAIFYQQIGPLPVVETVTTSVVLKLQAVARGQGRVRVQAGAIATLAGGVRYDPSAGWHSVADLDLSVDGSVPEASVSLDEVGVNAWLAARVDVRLYGLAGPFVAAGPRLEVVRDLANGDFDGAVGFRGRVGGAVKVFGLNVPTMPSFELFDVTKPVL